MPGVQVKWSADARDALREVTDAYLRRRAKARVEKYARSKKIPVITWQLAFPMIEETVGRDKLAATAGTRAKDQLKQTARRRHATRSATAAFDDAPPTWTPAGFIVNMMTRRGGGGTVATGRCPAA